MSRPVVIVNPGAGGGVSAEDLRGRLDFLGEPTIRETRASGDARRIARESIERGAAMIVVVGGDGTLNEALNGMAPDFDACPLAIVAAGTGNDAVRSLGLPLDTDEAIESLRRAVENAGGEPSARVDVMAVRHDGRRSWALNAATGGFGGAVNRAMTDEVRDLWGPLAYARAATEVASEPPVYQIAVSLDGAAEERLEAISVVVANGSLAAHGVPVAPGAVMDDGRLAVHAVLEAGPVDRLAIAAALLVGARPDHEAYRSWTCRRVEIRCDAGFPVSVDGELLDARDMAYEVVPSAITILGVPGSA